MEQKIFHYCKPSFSQLWVGVSTHNLECRLLVCHAMSLQAWTVLVVRFCFSDDVFGYGQCLRWREEILIYLFIFISVRITFVLCLHFSLKGLKVNRIDRRKIVWCPLKSLFLRHLDSRSIKAFFDWQRRVVSKIPLACLFLDLLLITSPPGKNTYSGITLIASLHQLIVFPKAQSVTRSPNQDSDSSLALTNASHTSLWRWLWARNLRWPELRVSGT